MLHLIHQRTHVVGHRIHTKGIETTIKHVGLDAYLIERLTECPNGTIRIFTCHQVYLLEGSTIGFNATETAHINNHGSYALKLILTGLKLS